MSEAVVPVPASVLAHLADRAQLLANAALALREGDLGDWRSRARVQIVHEAAAAHAADLRALVELVELVELTPAQDTPPTPPTPPTPNGSAVKARARKTGSTKRKGAAA